MTAEIEWRRRWKPDLRAKPWKRFVFGAQGKSYLMKFSGKNDCYDWLLTDYSTLWHEECSLDDIKKRVKKYNPSVEVHTSKLLDHIAEYTDNPNKEAEWDLEFVEQRENATGGKKVCLWLNAKLAGLPFCWKFKALPDNADMFKPYFTLPLVLMVGELRRQNAELVKMLRNKDKEIDDYKAQGSRVTRKHLETPQFDEVVFKNNMLTSKGFTENVKDDDQKIFDPEGQELYQAVMTSYAWLNRNPDEVGEGESLMEEAETMDRAGDGGPSFLGSRVPPSLASANTAAISPKNSPIKSPQKSPQKSPAKSPAKNTVDSPGRSSDTSPNTKDTELLRRQALERRLQEELEKKEQKAKKKKKLKL